MAIPPGISYLIPRLPRIVGPPLLVYTFTLMSRTFLDLGIQLSVKAFSALLVFSIPLAFSVEVFYTDFIEHREAAALGATLPPRTRDPTPGGIVSLIYEMRSAASGYPSDGVDETVEYVGGYAFNMRLLFENRMITLEPEHIKTILATHFEEYEKGPEFREVVYPLLGTGVFAADGELWKFHRSMTRPFFSRDRISHFDNFDRHADDALNRLSIRLREGYPIDFQDLASRFTLDSATEFLLGKDVRSLAAGLPYPFYSAHATEALNSVPDPATRFTEAFFDAQLIIINRSRFGVHWPLMEFWHDKIKEPMKIVHELIDPIVAEAVEKKRAGKLLSDEELGVNDDETLLGNLVNSTEDETILRDEVMSLLVAGRDTTSSTLTFMTYLLSEYPEVLRKLREEILSKVGLHRRPTYDDFRDMKYLKAVINETLRLYPPVPFNLRTAKKATIWPSAAPGGKPLYIPAQSRTAYGVFLMHRRTDLWGPDALEFDPERFLDHRLHKYLTPNPFIFLPFNAGPRICLGQQFAYNEISFFIVRLLQKFSGISLASDAQPPETRAPESWAKDGGRKGKEKIRPTAHLTLHIKGGLWVRMEEEKGDSLSTIPE